jgi:hypothetical protein
MDVVSPTASQSRGNPENDGRLSRWQEPAGHEIIPDAL